jgi:glycosyltransferase involved in cell wall biosynthesis
VLKDEAYFCKVKDSNNLASRIEEIIKNKKKSDAIGKRGIELAERYDWGNIAKQMSKFYNGGYDEKDYF